MKLKNIKLILDFFIHIVVGQLVVLPLVMQCVAAPHARPGDDRQSLVNSCTAQMMSYVATANASKGEFKIPVFSHAEDNEIVDSMQELVKLGRSISQDQDAGRVAERKQIERLNAILEKTGMIFKKRASIELDLCIEYNEGLLNDCTGIVDTDPLASEKLESCAKRAEEKPENQRKKEALLAVLKKRLLISKLAL